MSKATLPALALVTLACTSLAATPAKTHKRHHAATAAYTTPARKRTSLTTSATAAKNTKTTVRRKGKVSRSPVRYFQQAPTPDRYKEIQQALASKGYFKGEPTGEWGADSADALKRFQADQNLMPDGKLNSLSLIALGLGPRRLTAKSDAAPQTAPPVASPAPPPR